MNCAFPLLNFASPERVFDKCYCFLIDVIEFQFNGIINKVCLGVLLKFETHFEDTIHSDEHRLLFNEGEKVYLRVYTHEKIILSVISYFSDPRLATLDQKVDSRSLTSYPRHSTLDQNIDSTKARLFSQANKFWIIKEMRSSGRELSKHFID